MACYVCSLGMHLWDEVGVVVCAANESHSKDDLFILTP